MRKVLILIILFIFIAVFMAGCRDKNDLPERYSIEAGRAAFVQREDLAMLKSAELIARPDDAHIALPYADINLAIVYIVSEEVDSDLNPIYLYGLSDFEGNIVVECIYNSMVKSGNFFMGEKEDDEKSYDLYYFDNYLFNTPNQIADFVAVGEDYFALYTLGNSELFNKEGKAMFGVGRQMSNNSFYSICDEFLLVHEPDSATFFIWELGDKILFVKSYVSSQSNYYALSYIGGGKFLVITTSVAQSTNYNYYDVIDNTIHYYSQTAKILNRDRSETITVLEAPVIAVLNRYSPTITYPQRRSLNLKDGYSAVLTHKLSNDNQRIGQDYYVMNSHLVNVIKMQGSLSPFVMTYKGDIGFAGNAVANYAAALFYLNNDIKWTREDAAYYAQSFNNQKFVLAKSVGGQLKYGMLDLNGDTIIDFEYDFLATFTEGYSVGALDGTYYRINSAGERLEVLNDIRQDNTQFAFNSYIFESNGKLGLKNYAGDILIGAMYDSVNYQGYIEGKLYVIFNIADDTAAYKLS